MQNSRIEMVKMQIDVVLVLANAATSADFHGHAARDNVTRSKILGGRRITLHEALTFGIDEIAAFTACAFSNQATCAINTGWVELNKFHILKWQTSTCRHTATVTGAGVSRSSRKIGTSVTTGRQNHHLGGKAMDRTVVEVPGNNTGADAVSHDQIERKIFDEKLRIILKRLAIKRVQDGVAGTVSSSAGALYRRTITKVLHVATEWALINLTFFGTRERNAVMFQLIDRGRRFTRQIFHGISIAQPVRSLNGIVHVPLPAIRTHILERSRNTTLRRNRMGARRENLGDASRLQTLFGHAKRCTQSGTTGTNDDDIELVIDERIGLFARSTGCIVFCTSHQALNLRSSA